MSGFDLSGPGYVKERAAWFASSVGGAQRAVVSSAALCTAIRGQHASSPQS